MPLETSKRQAIWYRQIRTKRESGCHDPLRENFCALQSATSNASGV